MSMKNWPCPCCECTDNNSGETMLLKFTGAITGAAGAVSQFIWDYALGGSAGIPLQYPVPAGTALKLRVKPAQNASAAAIDVEVYKNAAPTGLKVTIPAGSTAIQTEIVTQVTFVENDLISLVASSNAGGAGNVCYLSGSLEFVKA